MKMQHSENNLVQSLPIDFVFVTVLPFMHDAIVQSLESCEIVEDSFAALAYYRGHITIPATHERYEVVVAMLLEEEIEDGEVAISVLKMIERWRPAYLITIGIASGISGKVLLGDIVVADFVSDHASIKSTPEEELQRTRQFPAHRILYAEAFSYQSREWKKGITLPWSGTPQAVDHSTQPNGAYDDITLPWSGTPQAVDHSTQPSGAYADITLPWSGAPQAEDAFHNVHFGAITSGKVITHIDNLLHMQAKCPELLALTKESMAIARACAQQPYPIPFLEVRGISHYVNEQNNEHWQVFAANIAAAFIFELLRSRPVPPLVRNLYQTKPQKPLLILCAQSYRRIAKYEVIDGLGQDAKSPSTKIVLLDFTDLMVSKILIKPEVAVKRLIDAHGPLQKALTMREETKFAFLGIVQLPLATLIGHLFSSRQYVQLFSIHTSSDGETWSWPNPQAPFPLLEAHGVPRRKNALKKVVALCISITYTVSPTWVHAVGLHNALMITLKFPHPERGVVRSEEQLREYGRTIRHVLDTISKQCPAVKCIHIFYAGPASLAFHMGQGISVNRHPTVIVWNFCQKYDWGIDLASALLGKPCIVHPQHPSLSSPKTDEYYRYFGD